MSAMGSTLPATWITLGSSKQRTTLTMASVSRIWAKLVTQAFALGGTGHQSRNVHELDNGRNDALRLDDFSQLLQAGSGTSTTPTLGSMVQRGNFQRQCQPWSGH